jgi:hypothetical protein
MARRLSDANGNMSGQARALAISTAVCGGVAVAAVVGLKYSGLETREVAQVASIADAIAVARQAREVTQREFQRKRNDTMGSASADREPG